MSRAAAIVATLVGYNLTLIAIGLWSQRRMQDGSDFFLGRRGLGPVVAAISASASSSSAWTLLGVSGFAYQFGLSSCWLFPACVGGFALNWYVLARPLRRLSHSTGALTVTEILAGPRNRRLHAAISILASSIVLVFLTAYVASQFQGAGKTFNETFGLSVEASILLGSGVVALYTLLGGFWAVSLTDTLQGLLMAAAALLLPAAALFAAGGPVGLVDGLSRISQEGYLSPIQNLGPVTSAGFVAGLLGIGLGYPGQPHVANRFMALRRGEKALITARRVALGWAAVVYAGMILLGLCGRVLFTDLADREVVFITASNELFPPVLAGVILAAVLSAIMSTADSQLLVAASAVTHDLRLGDGSTRHLLAGSRAVVLVLSGLAVCAALYGPREIFSPVLVAWSVMGAAFGPLILVTAIRGPVAPGPTLAAMASGLLLTIAGATYRHLSGQPWDPFWERVAPVAVTLTIALWPWRRRGSAAERRPRSEPGPELA